MKTIYPEFEGNELFINSSVESTDPDGFLEDGDSLWVDVSVQELLELVYRKNLISEDKYFEYINKEDRVISDEVLEGILELDGLVERRLINNFTEKLLNEYREEIKEAGGVKVVFNSGDEIIIKAGEEDEDEFI